MKVIILHDWYRFWGGEDAMVAVTANLLKQRKIDFQLVTHNSRILDSSFAKRVRAFCSGIYSFSAAAAIKRLIALERPDIVHINNLHPLFSPSVLIACRQAAVPIVMTCHNYRLVCPSGMHIRAGKICELCVDGKEYWCALTNCKGNIFQSVGYALRNIVHRKMQFFLKNVSLFLAISHFVRGRLIEAGLPSDRIVVLPNMVTIPDSKVDCSKGEYVAFAGRFSPQKGIETLLDAVRHTKLPLRLAGDYSTMIHLLETAPKEASFLGLLDSDQMKTFYKKARFVVVSSKCFEPFGLVAAEAMSHGLPVISSRIGGLTEIVKDGVTGLLFKDGSVEDLANKMNLLWQNPSMCVKMGLAAREKALREYGEEVYYERLMGAYEKAITMTG